MIKKLNNRENKKIIKNKSKYLVLLILMLISVVCVISASYAVFTVQLKGNRKYSLTVGTLDFSIDNEQNSIRLMNAYPMSDTEGKSLRPYTFSITNTGTLKEYYKISLITDTESQANCTGCTFLTPSKLRYSLTVDGVVGEAKTVSDQTVLELGELTKGQSKNYELRLWLNSEATIEEENKYYYGKIKVDGSQEEYKETVTFAGITESVNTTTEETMFNYTNEGCIMDIESEEITCPIEPTNGIYTLEDDDGISYFYRGQVNNLVKFGEHKNYYVYQDLISGQEFQTLEACESEDGSSCEKVLKNMAGTPMYWRIIRINGNGTIRMIYAGSSSDATGYDTGIGISKYASQADDIRYVGYTYDRDTTEIESSIKKEVDTWYSNMLEGTVYDTKIETGKFCSDTSELEEIVDEFDETCKDLVFAPGKRLYPFAFNLDGSRTPTFKCTTTTETYGGRYNLKAGLITSDEIIAAGASSAPNYSFYLHNGMDSDSMMGIWTMTPHWYSPSEITVEDDGSSTWSDYKVYAGYLNFESALGGGIIDEIGLIRPVINLKADTVFKEGTDGSITKPYEIEQNIDLLSFNLNHDESGNSVSFEVPLGVTWRGFAGSKYAVNDYYSFSVDSENNILVYDEYGNHIGYVLNSDSENLDYTKASDAVIENHTYVIYDSLNENE